MGSNSVVPQHPPADPIVGASVEGPASSTFHRARSHWFEAAQDYVPTHPLRGNIRADVCIIGGGINGLSTAYHLKKLDPGTSIALVEAEVIGFGASGRNAGQLLVAFGHGDFKQQLRRYGATNIGAAWQYVHEGIRIIEDLQSREEIDCDYAQTGFLETSLRAEGEATLDAYSDFLDKIDQARFTTRVSADELAEELNGPHFGAAIFDQRGGQLDPLKLMRGMKRAVEQCGVQVFEHSPVARIDSGPGSLVVRTGGGSVSCDKLVLATNAYTHLLEGLGAIRAPRFQSPLMVYASVTEPLSEQQWQALRWTRRSGVNVLSDLFYSFAPTRDGRIVYVGGYYVDVPAGRDLAPEVSVRFHREGHRHLEAFFPSLAGVRTTQSWGGPISITADFIPQVGVTRDPRILYACGCWGHGLPIGARNGQTLADLALERRTASTDVWFVQRPKRLWPGHRLAILSMSSLASLQRRAVRKVGRRLNPPMQFDAEV